MQAEEARATADEARRESADLRQRYNDQAEILREIGRTLEGLRSIRLPRKVKRKT